MHHNPKRLDRAKSIAAEEASASPWRRAVVVSAVCLIAYLAPGQSQSGNDATANVHLSLQLLEHHSLFFTPEDNPKMFMFAVDTPEGKKGGRIRDWGMVYQGRSARDAYASGDIRVHEPMYYLVPTVRTGRYANTFGLGAGLFALPVIAPVRLFVSDLGSRLSLLWWLSKLAAALSVAGAVGFVYVGASRALSSRAAVSVALAYGLATCAFSVSSQALWQHGPCELFLAMAAYSLIAKRGSRSDFLCGLGSALAVLCRPTAAVVVVCLGAHFLISDRRRLKWFFIGGAPVLVALCAYNQYAFGSPLSFGQLGIGSAVARAKTGNPALWQTPLWLGMAGLLFSPSRGLFVHTPLALLAVWGMWRVFRAEAWRDLRPLAVAVLLLTALASKWFDWWGGWCFGYRPIVDTVILLAFLSFPVASAISSRRSLKIAFAGLFAFSVGVQLLGAFAYDVAVWNGKKVWTVVPPGGGKPLAFTDQQLAARYVRERGGQMEPTALSVDSPEYRGRLWSLTDSPLVYYVGNLAESFEARRKATEQFLNSDG